MVKAGQLFRRVNEEEKYCYELQEQGDDRMVVTLKNVTTGLVFDLHRELLKKWYEPEQRESLWVTHANDGDTIVSFENGEVYDCVAAWACDINAMAYRLRNKKTGKVMIIGDADDDDEHRTKNYFRATPPGKFKDSKVYEDVCRMEDYFEPLFECHMGFNRQGWENRLRHVTVMPKAAELPVYTLGKILRLIERVARHESDLMRTRGYENVERDWYQANMAPLGLWYYHMTLMYCYK
jgi:hypothetical protein